jgi:hypothetical protein
LARSCHGAFVPQVRLIFPWKFFCSPKIGAEWQLRLVTLERMTDCTSGGAARSYRIMSVPDIGDDNA